MIFPLLPAPYSGEKWWAAGRFPDGHSGWSRRKSSQCLSSLLCREPLTTERQSERTWRCLRWARWPPQCWCTMFSTGSERIICRCLQIFPPIFHLLPAAPAAVHWIWQNGPPEDKDQALPEASIPGITYLQREPTVLATLGCCPLIKKLNFIFFPYR